MDSDQCLIWTAFAKRGLGFSATQGLSSSRFDGLEAFDTPAAGMGPRRTPISEHIRQDVIADVAEVPR